MALLISTLKLSGRDQVNAVPVRVRGSVVGFRVQVLVAPDSRDDLYQSLSHFALLSEGRAKALAARVKATGNLDLHHWVWVPSPSTPVAALQQIPVAKLERTSHAPAPITFS